MNNISNIPSPTFLVHLVDLPTHFDTTNSFVSSFISPHLGQFIHDYAKFSISIIFPIQLLYLAVFAWIKNHHKAFHCLVSLSLVAIWACPYAVPLECGFTMMIRNCAISSLSMKLLDLWVRRNALPAYNRIKTGKAPSDWMLSLLLVSEMRYESFTPNQIKLPDGAKTYTEPWDYAIYLGIYSALIVIPIEHPTLLAIKIMLSIYVSGTTVQMLFGYKSSPALFGPLYYTNSLAGFWSETWHNIYASACISLAYSPVRNSLRNLGVPKLISHAMGIIGVFSFMGAFHVYVMHPMLSTNALIRVGLFFCINGIATIAEAIVWGRKKHWVKALLAWTFEIALASWTASSMTIPIMPLKCSSGLALN